MQSYFIASTTVCGILLQALVGCGNGDYQKQLPGGYVLARTNANTKCIFQKNGKSHPSHCAPGIVVAAYIDELAITGKFVVGHIIKSPESELSQFEAPGFFVLNTDTGEVHSGLDHTSYLVRLGRCGVVAEPSLHSP